MKKDNLHYGHRDRLRKQVQSGGLDSLHEHQVLEYLLTFAIPLRDTNEIAHELINKFGSFSNVLDADVKSLKQVKGVGEVVANFLAGYKSFYFYYQKHRAKTVNVVRDFNSAKRLILPYLSNIPTEEIYIVGLDGNNKVNFMRRVSVGSENQALLNIRDVTDLLLTHGITNFVIAHNHPDGPAVPSSEDNKFTKALVFAMYLNNVSMLDHLIVGTDDVYSYYHSGLLSDYQNEAEKVLGLIKPKVAQPRAKYGEEQWKILPKKIAVFSVLIVAEKCHRLSIVLEIIAHIVCTRCM